MHHQKQNRVKKIQRHLRPLLFHSKRQNREYTYRVTCFETLHNSKFPCTVLGHMCKSASVVILKYLLHFLATLLCCVYLKSKIVVHVAHFAY